MEQNNKEYNEYQPFGLRVLIRKIDNPLSNFGKDIFEGCIVEVPTKNSVECQINVNNQFTNENKEIPTLDFNKLFCSIGVLSVGTKVLFKYNQEIIDNTGAIYNVPVELIRAYINEKK